VYIWHKDNGTLIEKLEGHEKGCCNSVAWNPANPCMFASAGDDGKVQMYVTLPAFTCISHAAN
jgi:WD40 repeat protein